MPNNVQLNKIVINIKDNFFDKYKIYKIRITDGKKLWPKIDDLKTKVVASCGLKENNATYLYLIVEKLSLVEIRETLKKADIPYDVVSMVYTDPPVKLFVNAAMKSKDLISLAGKNYYIAGISFYKTDKKLKTAVDIPEISVFHNGTIQVHQTRFLRANKNSKGPFFVLKDDTLERSNIFQEPSYIEHGLKDKKAKPLSYISLTESGFTNSRVWIIKRIVELIKRQFSGLVEISYSTAEDILHVSGDSFISLREEIDKNLEKEFRDTGVKSDIKEIYGLFNIQNKDDFKIKLIPDKKDDEPKDIHVPDLHTQHIQESTYKKIKNSENAMKYIGRALLTELAIKKGVLEGKDTFNDVKDEITCIYKDNDILHYCHKNDADLCFGHIDPIYENLPGLIPEEVLSLSETHIIIHNGNLFGLCETPLSPLAGEDAENLIRENHGKVRGEELRNKVAGGILDAHIYMYDNENYIYTSVIGKGMQSKIPKASYLIKVTQYTGKEESLEFLFPYLCVTYINAGDRYTKWPYLFKYITESIAVTSAPDQS